MAHEFPQARDWLILGGGNGELVEAWRTIVVEENPDPLAVRKSKWVILGAQASETAPPLWVRRFIADELTREWVSTPVQVNAANRQVAAAGLQMTIDQLVKQGDPQAKAREKVAADFEFPTVEALDRFLSRNK